ncbi:MAG: hypothetical protein ACRD1X_01755 [Vicinamibacteria bacterium]
MPTDRSETIPKGSKGEPASATRSARFRLEVLIELSLALLSAYIMVLAVFGELDLSRLGIPIATRDTNPALLACFVLLGVRTWLNRSRVSKIGPKPGQWLAALGTPGFILLSCFLFVFFLFHDYGGRLVGDGVINFVYVRSMVMDGDLDLTNEFEQFVPERFQYIAERGRRLGRPPDPSHEPGTSLLWVPAFLATHAAVKALDWFGSEIPADGYSHPYINAVSVMSVLWSFAAVVIAYRVSRRYFAPHLAAVSISVLWLSSSLLWYTVNAPTMPHATTAVAVSVFLYLWMKTRESPSTTTWIALGLVGGLLLSLQRYNVFYLIAPLITLCGIGLRVLSRDRRPSRRTILAAGLVALAFLLTALPLLLYNFYYSTDSSFFRMGDLGGFTLRYWSSPRIGEFLFSSNHGLFSWNPATYLAVIGLFIFFFRKDRGLAATLLVTLAGGIYLLSSTWDWYAGYSFGSRRLAEAFFIFALGFCALTEILLRRPMVLLAGAFGGLVVGNLLLARQVYRGDIPEMGTFRFADAVASGVRTFYGLVGHPPSAPASWLFAWRYGVSPAQFDLTYGHRPYNNLVIDVGSEEDRFFLGRGWSVREEEGGESYRWSVGDDSTWLVPLFEPFDYQLRLTGEASRNDASWSQPVSIEVNGRRAASLSLVEGWQTREVTVPASFWREGVNEIRLVYGWTVNAGTIYGNADSREIACRLTQLELEIIK